MRLNSIGFLFREAFSGLVRHRLMTLAAISTAGICFTVLGAFLATLYVMSSLSASLTSQLGVSVFMSENASRADTLAAAKAIGDLPGVAGVKIVTREQAWDRMKGDLGAQVPLGGVKGNPLTDEIHVDMRDVEHVAPVAAAARKVDGVDDVNVLTDEVRKVQATVGLVKKIGAGAGLLLLFATFAIIANVIRVTVFARRREIRIMQLVGATNGFIRTPFLLEGIFCGAMGAAGASAVVYYGARALLDWAHGTIVFLALSPKMVPAQPIAVALIALGGLVGLMGSAASVRRFLSA